ncbi:ribonuclease P protein component [Chlorogloeopsis sp. ULAP01]|uniref:ribonuclease P protein component n=1 Tax=Chlorogloeopsis sp. ULAP01 TaxID=3056483 RepID=UPI0025AACF0E|nr:ribonuclease P protein component [Chlorogloeopsis sp. ULAP01]MDM9381038.1 ribonuclease P protein component [Chlorogloeopsis sp. ULAP01]
MALPKAYRLKSRHDFQAVFREGIRRHGSNLTLRALRLSSVKQPFVDAKSKIAQSSDSALLAPTLIGISVSTKVSKRAVVRNRLKRQIAAALHQLLPKISPGWRLVVIVKPGVAESKCVTQQFLQELEQLLAQAEVLNGHS